MPATARLELRIAPDAKETIERAAELTQRSVTAFVTDEVLARAKELLEGPRAARAPLAERPVGGWSFTLPEGWDAPLEDLEDYR